MQHELYRVSGLPVLQNRTFASAEQARLDLGGGGTVVQRLAERAIGEAAAEKRRGEQKAGDKARSHLDLTSFARRRSGWVPAR